MAGIFTYMTGNWVVEQCQILLGNGRKDRKIPPRGRKWKGKAEFPGREGGAMAGMFTYMTGTWELLGNGLKDRKFLLVADI